MFDALTDRLGKVFDGLTGRGALSEKDVNEALREIRVALLEADVALSVVKKFIDDVRPQGHRRERHQVDQARPAGRQDRARRAGRDAGRGRRTAAAEDRQPARRHHDGRPAGLGQNHHHRQARQAPEGTGTQEGPRRLARHAPPGRDGAAARSSPTRSASMRCRSSPGQLPPDIARRAIQAAKFGGYDVLMLDTAGRTTLDDQMMNEADEIAKIANPYETLLVADALTGQDAVETAQALQRTPAAHRPRAHPHGRRRPRRRCALDARRHRPADPLHRHGREARRARRVRRPPHRRPHSRAGRHRLAGREGQGRDGHGRGRARRQEDAEGSVRPGRSTPASCARCSAWAASAA